MIKRNSILHLLLLAGIGANAQQTMLESNLLSDAVEIGVENATISDLRALYDGTDTTTARIEGNGGMPSLIVKFDYPINIGAINFVAGEDKSQAPKQVYVYSRDSDNAEWKVERRINAMSFPLPFVNFASTVGNQSHSQYKIEIRNIINGGSVLELSELQLVGNNPRADVVGEHGYMSLGKNFFDNGVLEDNAWNARTQIDFDDPIAVTGYSIGVGSNSKKTARPRVWELSGSVDGEHWVSLDMRSNQPQLSADSYSVDYNLENPGVKIDFGKVADDIYAMLSKNFTKTWGSGSYLIHSWSADSDKMNKGYNYWWMAHAVDAYVDAYARTGKNTYQNTARQIRTGMYTAYNAGRQDLFNDYNDDMEWMCIACCHAYWNLSIEKNKWLDEAKQLFDWIWQSWDDTTGGILWTVGSQRGVLSSKNSCSNAPAMICANYLYEITGDESYLEKSKMIFDFMLRHNLFEDGFVKDGPEQPSRGWAFTYNQGTWAGGLLGLYKATKDKTYYDIAVDLMDKSIDSRWYSPNGIMCESGKGDGGLFKGIYIRYITEWLLSGLLDEEREVRYAGYLLENARSLYLSALLKPELTIMANWQDRGESELDTYDSSVVLSGLFLLEGVDKLRRAGILRENYTVANPYHGKSFSHYRLDVTANYGGNDVELDSFKLFGVASDSGVDDITVTDDREDDGWYTLGGIKITEPSSAGIYIHKNKIIVKR